MKNSMKIPQKTKNKTTTLSEGKKILIGKDTCTPNVHSSIIYNIWYMEVTYQQMNG